MARELTISQVKDDFSSVVRSAQDGQTVTVTVNGRAAAKVVPAGGAEAVVGSGAWALADDNVSGYPPFPFTPAGFVEQHSGRSDAAEQLAELANTKMVDRGLDRLLQVWAVSADRGRECAIVWRHLTAEAAVIAVPTAYWRGFGSYRFFHTTAAGAPISALAAWSSDLGIWDNNAPAFHDVRAQARAVGSRALGILISE